MHWWNFKKAFNLAIFTLAFRKFWFSNLIENFQTYKKTKNRKKQNLSRKPLVKSPWSCIKDLASHVHLFYSFILTVSRPLRRRLARKGHTNFGHQFENRYSYETKRKLDTVSTSYGSKSTGQIEYVVNAQPVHVSSYEDATSSDSCAGQ